MTYVCPLCNEFKKAKELRDTKTDEGRMWICKPCYDKLYKEWRDDRDEKPKSLPQR